MGKRARKKRAEVKKVLRFNNIRTNEYGELTKKQTKAEVRQRLAEAVKARRAMQAEIIESITEKVREEICAAEDERVFAEIDRIVKER